jgi:DNA-binding GntR family transcriptional regulator
MSENPMPDETGVVSLHIADHLREAILNGGLPPGSRIRQVDLAKEFGFSRLPAREALRILETEGLVTIKANSGAWVTRMDLEELELVYKVRQLVEPIALKESIDRLTPDDIAEMTALQDAMEANTDIERFLVLDRQFHLRSYSGCHVESLSSMVQRFWNTTQHYRRAFARVVAPERLWVVAAEHRLLIDAIARGSKEDAGHVLSGHIMRTRLELENHPEVFETPAGIQEAGRRRANARP